MAELDPLRFAVELLDIEQSKIDAAWSKVERAFENRTLKVKVDGEKGAAQDSESLAVALKDVSENLKSIRQLLQQGGFKTLGDEAQKAAQQMDGLARSMQQVNDGMAKSEAWQSYVRALEGVAAALKQVDDTASKTAGGDGGLRAQLSSLARAMKEIEVINQLTKEVRSARAFVGDGGFNAGTLDGYLSRLQDVRAELGKIVGGYGLHPDTLPGTETQMRTNDLLNLKFYQELQKSIQGTLKDIKQFKEAAKPVSQPAIDLTGNPTYIRNYEKATSAVYELEQAIRQMNEARSLASNNHNTDLVTAIDAQINRLKAKYQEILTLRDDIQKMQSDTALVKPLGADYKKLIGDDTKGLSRQAKELERDTSAARQQMGELIAAWRQLQTLIASGRGNEQIRSLQEQIYNMVHAMRSGLRIGTPSVSLQAGAGGDGLIRKATAAMKSYEQSEREAARAGHQLAESQDRAAHAILNATDASRKHSQVLGDLKQMAMQYLSVWGAKSFIDSIIETGGQLEQQRLSMSAILQDADTANEIFKQIKALAIQSPFGVVQLDQMSKQLAAYGFEAKELFDWTKRLADISAATGTDVSRLALALGHVRSEGALSGYTLRQFSMGNVPLLRMLSESRGVSTKEIRDLVRKKEISDKEVSEVLVKLTSEGGMFYNAQEVMSGALNAKFKNLHDAFDIMYGEIAESGVGNALKSVATALTAGAKEWKRYGTDMLTVIATYGALKSIIYLSEQAMGAHTASILKSAVASKQKEAANLRLIQSYRQLTAEEQSLLANRARLTSADWALLLSTQKLTFEDLKRAVALKRISVADAERAVALANLKNATLQLNAAELQGVRVLGAWQRVGFQFRSIMNGMKTAVASFMRTFWPMLVIGAIVDILGRTSGQEDRAAETGESMANSLMKKQKELIKLRESLEESRPRSNDELNDAIKNVTESLKANGRYTEELRVQVETTEKLTDKYRILKMELNAVTDEYAQQFETIKAGMEMAMHITFKTKYGGWHSFLADDINENFADLDKARMKMLANLASHSAEGIDMHTWLRDAANHGVFNWKSEYEEQRWSDVFADLPKAQQSAFVARLEGFKKQLEEGGSSTKAIDDVLGIVEQYQDDVKEFENKKDDIRPEWNEHKSIVLGALMDKNNIRDLKNMTDEQKRILAEDIHNLKEGLEGRSKWFRDWWEANMLNGLGIRPYIVEDATDDLEQWQQELQAYFDENHIDFKVKAADTWDSIREGLKKHKDELQKEIDRDTPILLRFGLQIDGIPSDIEQFLTDQGITSPWQHAYYTAGLSRIQSNQQQLNGIKTAESETPGLVGADKNKNKGGHQEDKEAKRLREEVKLVKDAYDWWKKYRELMSDDAALKVVQERYADFFKEAGVKIDLKDIPNYKASLEAMLAEAEKLYKQKGHHNSYMADVIKELKKAIEQVDYDDLKRRGDEWASALGHEVEELTRKFEIFSSVLESTGDEGLAMRVASVGGNDVASYRKGGQAEVVKRRLQVERPDIDFDKVLGLDDEGIEKYVKDLYGASDAVKGVAEQLTKWRDLQREVIKADIEDFAKLIGSAVDFQSAIQKIESEYQDALTTLQRLRSAGTISRDDYSRGVAIAGANRNRRATEALPAYQALMDGIKTVTAATAKDVKQQLVNALQKQLHLGVITAKEYADKLKAINQRMQELEKPNGGLYTYATGGLDGLIQRKKEKGDDMIRDGAQMQQAGQTLINKIFGKGMQQVGQTLINQIFGNGMQQTGEGMQAAGEGMQAAAENMQNVIAIIDMIVHGIDSCIQGLKQAYDNINEMLDALGSESASDARSGWGKTGTALSALSSGSTQAASAWDSLKNGDAGGVISGVVGSFTKPITVFAQAHDARRQAAIEDLKRDVSNIDANIDIIKSLRQRELGYDRGRMRREMAAMYRDGGVYDSQGAAGTAMSAFYGVSGSNGYEQELNQLKKKRQDYVDMYNKEDDKKKKSKETLLEYKEQIAELDEQIRYFTEDLAKELWSIDIKGWADQISDALMNAFENGENAAEAYKDAVTSIMQTVVNEMLKVGIIEPMLEHLRQSLFGYTDEKGVSHEGIFDIDDLEGSMPKVVNELGKFFGEGGEGENTIVAAQQLGTSMQKLLESYGLPGIIDTDNGETLSASVKGTSEETSGLLAGYVNAMRQDVSVNRLYLMQIAGVDIPDIKTMLTGGNATLQNIDTNTRALVRMMEQGDGALYREIAAINDRLERFAFGHDKITIN